MKKRNRLDPNEIVIYKDYAEIILYDKNNNEKARAIIDIDDINKVKVYKWGLSGGGYARNETHRLFLHRLITNCPEGMIVDHINRNRLDNRKSNLRIVNDEQNSLNQGLKSNNTSGYKGVSWNKRRNKWEVYINVNKKRIKLGYYDDLEEAIKVRKEAEIKYHGEYRRLE